MKLFNFLIVLFSFLTITISNNHSFAQEQNTIFFDQEVQEHYNNFQPKYFSNDCRIWIDYAPKRKVIDVDLKMHAIAQRVIINFNKFMIYNNWEDLGGSPGLHIAFSDYCEQKEELAYLISNAFKKELPYIDSVTVVAHSQERDSFDIGELWKLYLDNFPK